MVKISVAVFLLQTFACCSHPHLGTLTGPCPLCSLEQPGSGRPRHSQHCGILRLLELCPRKKKTNRRTAVLD
jgi:hypothetical protein